VVDIKIDLRYDVVLDCIDLTQNRDQWLDFLKEVMTNPIVWDVMQCSPQKVFALRHVAPHLKGQGKAKEAEMMNHVLSKRLVSFIGLHSVHNRSFEN
jgi:hypothetical protein